MMVARKKEYRWEIGRAFVDRMLPTLPGPAYVAVVMYCWFRARGESTTFTESNKQIAKACRISDRWVRYILADLERAGCVKTIRKGGGGACPMRCLIKKSYKAPPVGGGTPLPKPRKCTSETPEPECHIPDAEHLDRCSASLHPIQIRRGGLV